MKADKLIEYHMQDLVLSNSASLDPTDECAALYGTDEFKINYKKHAVRLPTLGWISCVLDKDAGRADWIAVFRDDGDWSIVFGTGNPYDDSYVGILPSKNGHVTALPHALTVGAALPVQPNKTVFDI